MGHMAFRRFENHLIVVSDAHTPAAEEWTKYLEACVQINHDMNGRLEGCTSLIFTDGGNPDSSQRVALKKLMFGRSAPTALVSDSLTTRAAVGLVGLFNKGIKAFPSSEWKQAALLACIPEAKHMDVLRIAVGLSHEVTECKVLRAIGL